MATETLRSHYDLIYSVDEYGHRRRRTEQEIALIELKDRLKDFLDNSTLSFEDIQRLRSLSANYNVSSTPLPEDDIASRRLILDYLSSDLKESTEEDATGLRRLSSNLHGVTIVVDGYPLPINELELVYGIIEPSTESLNRPVEEAAYFYVPKLDEGSSMEVQPTDVPKEDGEGWGDDDVFEPEFPTDRARLLAGKLARIGGRVISMIGLRPVQAESAEAKIAS